MSPSFHDTDDDLPLHTRGAAADNYSQGERRAAEVAGNHPAEREVTLNTGIVLALFFALALLCAVFFGFGYSIGHKSAPAPIVADTDTATPAESSPSVAASAKPSPGSPAAQPVPEYIPPSGGDRTAPASAKAAATPPANAVSRPPAATPEESATGKPAPVVRVPPVADTAAAPTPGSGTMYVQIAAVSHQEDADVLLSALRRRGYTVQTRSESADKLMHVQIGPFSNRKDAEATRQKLAGDGYNAFIK